MDMSAVPLGVVEEFFEQEATEGTEDCGRRQEFWLTTNCTDNTNAEQEAPRAGIVRWNRRERR